MNIDNDHIQFADQLADASRAIIKEAAQASFDLEIKEDLSPVTSVDKRVEDTLRQLIADKFPDHGILGEERADTAPDAEFKWIIDPIDGTLPFLAGLPVFGTLIALVCGDAPVIGVIDMPMTNDRWLGCDGQQTTRNNRPASCRSCDDLSQAMMSTSNPNFYNDTDKPALARMNAATRWCVYGGSCMTYGQLASGRIDVGIEVAYNIHDYLALVPVINGAGGKITDWNGANLTVHSGDRFVATGDSKRHGQVLQIVNSA